MGNGDPTYRTAVLLAVKAIRDRYPWECRWLEGQLALEAHKAGKVYTADARRYIVKRAMETLAMRHRDEFHRLRDDHLHRIRAEAGWQPKTLKGRQHKPDPVKHPRPCTYCGAAKGVPCVSRRGKWVHPHAARTTNRPRPRPAPLVDGRPG